MAIGNLDSFLVCFFVKEESESEVIRDDRVEWVGEFGGGFFFYLERLGYV